MIVRDRNMELTPAAVQGAIGEFMRDVRPRLSRLAKAYEGQGAITARMRPAGLPNNRLVHAFPRYIVTMAAGYLVGKPVVYSMAEETPALHGILRDYAASDMDSVDAELATDASIYGRGVCICYTDEAGKMKCSSLDPRAAFVVYDDTVEHRPLFGVHWRERYDENGRRSGMSIHVHTAQEEITYEGRSLTTACEETQRRAYYFGGVPMVEFWNNAQESGDFEPVLSLIEAYDALESDRINDKQ